jgi:hypothetical protein
MSTISLLSLGAFILAPLAQAVAFPQPSTTHGITAPSATFTFGNTGSTSTGMAIGIIVAIAVVVVCGVCGCCGMIWWFCTRHRKNMRRIRAGQDMTPAIPQEQVQQTTSLINGQQSNIVPLTGQYPDGYFDRTQRLQGQQTASFDAKMSPQTPSTANITPMTAPGTPTTQYQQPYRTANHQTELSAPQYIHEMPDNPVPVAELKG